jgi:hypothetical protein
VQAQRRLAATNLRAWLEFAMAARSGYALVRLAAMKKATRLFYFIVRQYQLRLLFAINGWRRGAILQEKGHWE